MNIIAVDDENPALTVLERAIRTSAPEAQIHCFTTSTDALSYADRHPVDVAFIDIEMPKINGLKLAHQLKKIRMGTNIIFVTGYAEYMANAFSLHASGYLLKPVSAPQVLEELRNLRHPTFEPDIGLYVQCFGHFEVFMNGKPVLFSRPKAKEMLAYLIDRRGANVSKRALASILWEDESYSRSIQSHLYVLLAELLRVLDKIGTTDILIKRRGLYAVNIEKIPCDYYRFLQGNAQGINRYRGEYMVDYSWAESTAGQLTHWE